MPSLANEANRGLGARGKDAIKNSVAVLHRDASSLRCYVFASECVGSLRRLPAGARARSALLAAGSSSQRPGDDRIDGGWIIEFCVKDGIGSNGRAIEIRGDTLRTADKWPDCARPEQERLYRNGEQHRCKNCDCTVLPGSSDEIERERNCGCDLSDIHKRLGERDARDGKPTYFSSVGKIWHLVSLR